MKGKRVICYACIFFILCIVLKTCLIGRRELILPEGYAEYMDGMDCSWNGEIYKIEEKSYGQLLYLECEDSKWLVYDYNSMDVALGNVILVDGELRLFDEARNPGNFDAKQYYNTLGIVASIVADSVVVLDDSKYFIRNYLQQVRQSGIDRIYDILGESEGSLLVAMVFGEKDDMDDEQEELYQKIGISHIFAISGLHISLLSLVVYQFIRRVSGSFVLAGILSGILLGLYVMMIGMGISAIRAGVMFLIKVGADITGRVYDVQTSLAISAFCILILNPEYLYYSGFQLSFGAILGIIYLQPFLEAYMQQWLEHRGWEKKKFCCYLVQGISVSLAVQFMILPILLYTYYEVSPYSIILNLLIVPIMTLLLGIAMFGIGVSLIWYSGGAMLILLSGWFLQVINLLGEIFLSFYGSRWIIGKPLMITMVLYYIGLLGGRLYYGILYALRNETIKNNDSKTTHKSKIREHKQNHMLMLFFCVLPMLLLIHEPQSDLTVTMLDIGQGDCFLIQGPEGGTYLIDGGSTDISNVGKYRIEPYLRSIGIGALDYVFISHGDADHLNGVSEMLERQELGVRIHNLVLCEEQFFDEALIELITIAQENTTNVLTITTGDQILEGEMELNYIAPLDDYNGEIGNASSMILELCMGEFQMLFTGDAEGEGEEVLLEILSQEGKTYQILKVAHHGSKNSTSEEFLECVQPKIALISAGVDSIYGHPHDELIDRLEEKECFIYQTAREGGVVLSYNMNGDTINIEGTLMSSD